MANLDTFRRGIVPRASEEEVRAMLWNCSPYPFIRDVRKLRRSIRKCLNHGGGTVSGAIHYSHSELDRAMAQRKPPTPDSSEAAGNG